MYISFTFLLFYDEGKGACDKTKKVCVSKFSLLMQMISAILVRKMEFSLFFLLGCLDDTYCTYDEGRGACDISNKVCVSKFSLLIQIMSYHSNINQKNQIFVFCFLSGCIDDIHCTYDENKAICDIEDKVRVGKFNLLM